MIVTSHHIFIDRFGSYHDLYTTSDGKFFKTEFEWPHGLPGFVRVLKEITQEQFNEHLNQSHEQ
jgi:hypothetical protein